MGLGDGVASKHFDIQSPVAFPQIAPEMFGSPDDAAVAQRTIVTSPPEYVLGPVSVSENVHVIYLISPAK